MLQVAAQQQSTQMFHLKPSTAGEHTALPCRELTPFWNKYCHFPQSSIDNFLWKLQIANQQFLYFNNRHKETTTKDCNHSGKTDNAEEELSSVTPAFVTQQRIMVGCEAASYVYWFSEQTKTLESLNVLFYKNS